MSDVCILGIDLGLDGGLAFLDLAGDVRGLHHMPTRTAPNGKRDVDAVAIDEVLLHQCADDGDFDYRRIRLAVVEKVGAMPKQGVVSTFSFGRGTGKVLAVLELRGAAVQEVDPKVWKKVILVGTAKNKAAAIGFATSNWPAARAQIGTHDGLADALCIAEYGRRLLVGKGAFA